jgi:predicted phage terminase large subunit-like protein
MITTALRDQSRLPMDLRSNYFLLMSLIACVDRNITERGAMNWRLGVIRILGTNFNLIRNLVNREDGTVKVVRGSTFDNAQNLAPQALIELQARYAGTRMGRQELYGELLNESDSALWTRALLDEARIDPKDAPPYYRCVVAIDPAVTSGESSDETGIVVAGATPDGHYYILEDASMKGTPEAWARKAVEMYKKHKCDRVIGEANNGGDMIESLLRQVDPSIPYRKVHASRGKKVRAEPISALSEQLRLHLVGSDFAKLEDQLVTWEPDSNDSPDRMDAMVWAITELMGNSTALRSLAAMADFCPSCRLPVIKGTRVCPRCKSAIITEAN